jgi:type III secretory pathway component EscV
MAEKSFEEWINTFVTINLVIVAVLMLLFPVYPWWFFAVLALISKVVGPVIVKNVKKSSKSRSRY